MSKIISIQELENTPSKELHISVNDTIEGLDLTGPLTAELTARDLGEFVEITGNVKGNVKLVCDYCLKDFNYKLDFDIDEMFAKTSLSDGYGEEFELKSDGFVTDLCGEDEIDIYDLLYQSVILNIPNQKVCGSIDCTRDNFISETEMNKEINDPRMDVFKNIKINPK